MAERINGKSRGEPPPPDPNAAFVGGLIIDKPLRMTSMTVCRDVKRRLIAGGATKKIKVGQAGTLDPLASGVIVVLVGKATKWTERFMATRKRYIAEVDLGHRSNTDDLEGELTPIHVFRPPSREQIETAAATFVGVIQQKPPIFSALQVGGKRAYHLARDGKIDELPARPVTIHSLRVIAYEFPMLSLDIDCGKGTYIRSLARDVGTALGTGGMLAGLRRTAVGGCTIERATALQALPEKLRPEHLLDEATLMNATS